MRFQTITQPKGCGYLIVDELRSNLPCIMENGITNILSALQRSSFRAKFRLSGKESTYLHEKGLETIKRHAYDFINGRVAPAAPKNDGKQTPMKGHPVFIAQHATATCCRNCIRKWHKIEKGRALTGQEVDYLVEVIMAWMEGQVSGVGEQVSGDRGFVK